MFAFSNCLSSQCCLTNVTVLKCKRYTKVFFRKDTKFVSQIPQNLWHKSHNGFSCHLNALRNGRGLERVSLHIFAKKNRRKTTNYFPKNRFFPKSMTSIFLLFLKVCEALLMWFPLNPTLMRDGKWTKGIEKMTKLIVQCTPLNNNNQSISHTIHKYTSHKYTNT